MGNDQSGTAGVDDHALDQVAGDKMPFRLRLAENDEIEVTGEVDRLHVDVGFIAAVEVHEGAIGEALGRGHESRLGPVAGRDIFGGRPGSGDARGDRALDLREYADQPRLHASCKRARQFEPALGLGA